MKCPKCHYLSFEPEPRCRNCGYTLSLDEPDLPITFDSAPDEGPLADLALRLDEPAPAVPAPMPPAAPREEPPLRSESAGARLSMMPAGPFDGEPEPATRPPAVGTPPAPARNPPENARAPLPPRGVAAPPTAELPLFMKGFPPAPAEEPPAPPPEASTGETSRNDEPMIRVPAEPRPPLAVRRPVHDTPTKPRPGAATRRIGPLDRDLLDDLQRIEQDERRDREADARAAAHPTKPYDHAGAASRLGAAAFDALLLTGLSAALVGVTLRWCDLTWSDVRVLPAGPTAAFLLVVVLGYLLMFTAAGGQTVGKMVFGLRVVDAGAGDGHAPLTIRQALYRELISMPSVLALGAGFVPALIGDERAFHDRVAGTRVVRA